jgi:diguanylate cyclase (GGDEF)-like protein
MSWLATELAGNAETYLYVALSTALAFWAFGLILGRQADRLEALAGTDALTGLLNRRALEGRFAEEFARALRFRHPLSVLALDLDGLKEVNDREGHRRGDAALRATALALRAGCRITDVAARWGGDEFAVLAPVTTLDEALGLAERIRGTAASESRGGLTVSIGVVSLDLDHPPADPEVLLSRADAALYAAKALGRNRVVAG